MLEALLLLATLGAAGPQVDTTVQVEPGDRLVIADLRGEVRLEGWDQDLLEIADDRNGRISVNRSGSTLNVRATGGRRRGSAEAIVRVPRWMDVRVGGAALDVSVLGLGGRLEIATASGDVQVQDVAGPVDIRTVRGEVLVTDARGGVSASSQSDDVVLHRVSGPIEAHSGDGDVELEDIVSSSVRVEVQDGDIVFVGGIADGGDYGFYAHDGDVVLAIPVGTNAAVHVSTFDGEFQSEFAVRVERFTAGREFDFVLGSGSARIEVEVFDGDIALVRN